MRHKICRQALIDGTVDAEVQRHVDGCPPCRIFVANLATVREVAPQLIPHRGPSDLADRVIGALRTGETIARPASATAGAAVAAALGAARSSSAPLPWRRTLVAAATAGAVITAVVVVLPDESDDAASIDGRSVLLASAERTATLDTARLSFDGTADIFVRIPEIRLPTRIPDPGDFIPELPEIPDIGGPFGAPDYADPYDGIDAAAEGLERARQAFVALRSNLRHALGSFVRRPIVWPELPRDLHISVVFDGDGEIVRPDRLHLAGTVRGAAEDERIPPAPQRNFEIIVVGSNSYVRRHDGKWQRVPGARGPFAPLVLDADAAVEVLRHPRGTIEDRGQEVLDGVRVRHLRFLVAPTALPVTPATGGLYTADVWIGEDDKLLRKLSLSSRGEVSGFGRLSVRWRVAAEFRLFDFGADVTVEPPPEEDIVGPLRAPAGIPLIVYPFHPAIRFSTSGG